MKTERLPATLLALLALASPALADPCGMVPPIWFGDGDAITRVGIQRTYVFHSDGVETLVNGQNVTLVWLLQGMGFLVLLRTTMVLGLTMLFALAQVPLMTRHRLPEVAEEPSEHE